MSGQISQLQNLQSPMVTIHTLSGTGVLNVSTIQGGGEVYIDGESYGSAPITVVNIEPGLHTYTVKLVGYTDYVKQVDIIVGQICCEIVNMSYSGSTGTCTTAPTPPEVGAPPVTTPGVKTLTPFEVVVYSIIGALVAIYLYKLLVKE